MIFHGFPDFALPKGSMEGVYGIFTYIHHRHQTNVRKYISPMDPLGYTLFFHRGKYLLVVWVVGLGPGGLDSDGIPR